MAGNGTREASPSAAPIAMMRRGGKHRLVLLGTCSAIGVMSAAMSGYQISITPSAAQDVIQNIGIHLQSKTEFVNVKGAVTDGNHGTIKDSPSAAPAVKRSTGYLASRTPDHLVVNARNAGINGLLDTLVISPLKNAQNAEQETGNLNPLMGRSTHTPMDVIKSICKTAKGEMEYENTRLS